MKNRIRRALAMLVIFPALMMTLTFQSFAANGNYTPVDGVQVSVSNATNTSGSTSITVTAKGSAGVPITGWGASAKTATITVKNSSTTSAATIGFHWVASSVNELIIDGTPYTATSGDFSKVMDAGSEITITITTAKNNTTNQLVLSAFSWTGAKTSSQVTFSYNSSYGGVTVDGTAVTTGTTKEIAVAGSTVTATVNNGNELLGWIDSDGKILSTAASFTLKPDKDMTVTAVFVNKASDTAWFIVDSTYLSNDLDVACSKGSMIMLANNGTLPAKATTYTIPASDTLLIPFDASGTCYTNIPAFYDPGSTDGRKAVRASNYEAVSAYRTLTMADGAKITVNGGNISVSAKHAFLGPWNRPGNIPIGKVGMINMLGNSSITFNGGNLYAWGYIYGSGTITMNTGSNVYELLTIADYPGGAQANDIQHEVFPISQYFVQNIETELTIYNGATEYVFLTAYVPTLDTGITNNPDLYRYTQTIPFIASSGGLFNMTSGYMVKDYIESEDRISFTQYGTVEFGSIALNFGTASINSSNYVLPLTSNMTYRIASGFLSLPKRIAMIPGSRFIVDQGATMQISTPVYVYDADQWGNYSIYTNANENNAFHKFASIDSIGGTYTRTDADLHDAYVLVDGTVDCSKGYIYTTSSGANISSTGTGIITTRAGSETVTYQCTNYDSQTYDNIPITPAKLKNVPAAYPYTETAKYSGTVTYYYDSTEGVWRPEVAQRYDASGNPVGDPYTSLAKAIADQPNNSGYIRMTRDSYYENITTNKAVYLDLNGCIVNLNGTATFGTLYGMDTTTNAFGAGNNYTYGSLNGTITGTVADHHRYAGTGKYYATSLTGNTYSFHRFDLGVEKYTFYKKGDSGTLVFDMVVKGDEKALAEIAKTGAYIFDTESSEYQWTPDKAVKYSGHIVLSKEQFAKLINVQAAVQMADANATPIVNDRENFYARQISLQALLDAMNNGGAG